ncbi:hypothetical protein LFM09_38755 [Lentzea alba]|uniref:hypothetical protein n=1 Tax=Lentzea alba TaxID=2714351 RepID=UPI0039BFDBED
MAELIGDDLVAWGVEHARALFECAYERDPGSSEARVAEAVVLSALVSARTGRADCGSLISEGDRATKAAVARGTSVEVVVQGVQRT